MFTPVNSPRLSIEEAILLSERCRVDRIEDIYLSNQEEEIHELLVEKELLNQEREI